VRRDTAVFFVLDHGWARSVNTVVHFGAIRSGLGVSTVLNVR
jgi:hypothetical protein